MQFKPGAQVRYIGSDPPTLAKGVTGVLKSSTTLTAKVDFNGTVHEVVLSSLQPV